jgi:hypothetical protein
VRVYRAALLLYPRRFRREYGEDMVALLEEQLRDEGALRVVGRTALDLLVTIPASHLEVRMPHSTTTPIVISFVGAAAVLAVVAGPFGIVAAVASLTLALMVWRRGRPVVAVKDSRWWKLLVGGVTLMGSLIVVTTLTGELPDGGWFIAMVAMLTSLGLIGAGLVLGIVGRFRSVSGA